jgi:CHRD domain
MKALIALLLLGVVLLLAAPAAPQQPEGPGGTFLAELHDSSIAYELSYQGLLTQATVAHIHIGQRNVAGSIAVFLCGGGGKPDCPSPTGTVTGTITADDVMAIPAQELDAGDLPKLLTAMRNGLTYANVHTTAHSAGELRGQIRTSRVRVP